MGHNYENVRAARVVPFFTNDEDRE
jgi:hypothetical protein